ncbi:MAG: DUF5777 family beta-barrel protein [Bacteroidota bacterium]|jgi:hypothetical protein
MIKYFTSLTLTLLCFFTGFPGFAQDFDLQQMLNNDQQQDKRTKKYVQGTFFSTRLINGHSVENLDAGVLDFRISHRFGKISDGLYDMFGLDNASVRLGLDYGVTDKLMLGIGRSSFQKQVDGYVKYKILSQTEDKSMPISVSWVSSVMVTTLRFEEPVPKNEFNSRLYYAHQVLFARKFSEGTSFQLMPTLVHYNLAPNDAKSNDLFSIGIGGKQKIMKKLSLNAEYYYQVPSTQLPNRRNSFSIGFDIETGGHVFQLHVTNSRGMNERSFIHETDGGWDKGDLLFGFNISRVFSFKKHK